MTTLTKLFGIKRKSQSTALDFIVVNHPVERDIQPQEINLDLEIIEIASGLFTEKHLVGMVNDTIINHKCYEYGEAMIKYMPMYCKILEYARRITEMYEDVNFDTTKLHESAKCELDKSSHCYRLGHWSNSATVELLTSKYLYQEFEHIDQLKNKYNLFRKCYGMVKHLYNKSK